MDIKKYFQSKGFKITIIVIGVLIVELLVFQAGMFTGFKKASFSYGFGDNYYRNFNGRMMGENDPMMRGLPFNERDLENSHGAIGKIVKITSSSIVVADQGGIEKIVAIGKDTIIKQFRDNVDLKNLKVGDFVVVLGTPNDKSEIEAKLVRLMPSPPSDSQMMNFGTTTKTK